jgi:hypothetical protein
VTLSGVATRNGTDEEPRCGSLFHALACDHDGFTGEMRGELRDGAAAGFVG